MAEDWTPSELLQILLPASVHRGPHAFGWMYCTRDGKVHYAKYKGRSNTKAAISKMVIRPEHEPDVLWIVGHVRYYTNGTPDNMHNNHPIHHKKIVGVHNGVIRNYRDILRDTGRHYPDAEVDSEAIFAAVNRWGHRAGLRRLRGDMVAVYTNLEKPEVLHLARTQGRPLVFNRTRTGSTIFASEDGILESTGMVAGAYSALSLYRLVRLKGGRIVERVALTRPTEEWRKFEGAAQYNGPEREDFEDTLAQTYKPLEEDQPGWQPPKIKPMRGMSNRKPRVPRVPRILDPEVQRMMDLPQSLPPDPEGSIIVRPTRPARGYARSASLRDGDPVGSKIYYGGLLLTREEYVEQVNGRSKPSALDES